MERKGVFIKGKEGHPEIKNPYLIARERGNDRAYFEGERRTQRMKRRTGTL